MQSAQITGPAQDERPQASPARAIARPQQTTRAHRNGPSREAPDGAGTTYKYVHEAANMLARCAIERGTGGKRTYIVVASGDGDGGGTAQRAEIFRTIHRLASRNAKESSRRAEKLTRARTDARPYHNVRSACCERPRGHDTHRSHDQRPPRSHNPSNARD